MDSFLAGVVYSFLAAFLWSLAAVFYSKALLGIKNPLVMNLFRIPLALVVLVSYALFNGVFSYVVYSLFNVRFLVFLTLATFIMNVVGDSLYLLAIRNAGVSVGVPLSYMYPVYVALLSSIFLNEVLTVTVVSGTIIAVLGVWFVSMRKSDRGESLYNPVVGALAGVGAAISFSFGIILFKIAVGVTNPISTAIVKLIILSILIAPVIPIKRKELSGSTKRKILTAVIGGVFGIGVGDLMFYEGLKNITATLATTITTSTHAISLTLSKLTLNEKITYKQVLGVALIMTGIIIALL